MFIPFLALAAAVSIPLHFEPNRGQAPAGAAFVARTGGTTPILLSATRLAMPDAGMTLAGASPRAAGKPGPLLPGRSHYLTSSDKARWITELPQYATVRFSGVYPGIDVLYYSQGGHLEYDFLLRPHADPAQIRLRFDAPHQLELRPNGDLQVGGAATLRKPVAYQGDTPIAAHFRLSGREVTFDLGPYDKSKPLTIDPVLTYSATLGSSGRTQVAMDEQGNSYISGSTSDPGLPLVASLGHSPRQNGNLFLARLNPTGTTLLSSTYLGGVDWVSSILLDTEGNIYIAGDTSAADFPLVSPPEPAPDPFTRTGFLVKLPNAANAISVSTFARGWMEIHSYRAAGNILILRGSLGSAIERRNASTLAVTSTVYGRLGQYTSHRVTTDANDHVFLAGSAGPGTFPATAGAFQSVYGGGDLDVWVAKLAPDGTTVIWATLLGGSGYEVPVTLKVDASGAVYVQGFTTSTNLPTTAGAPQRNYGGGTLDGFVTKICPNGTCLEYSTYVGGSQTDRPVALELSASGHAIAVGYTESADFPTVNAVQPAFGYPDAPWTHFGRPDISVTRINPAGTAFDYSTYLGGSHRDEPTAVAAHSSGAVLVAADTQSPDFPVTPGAVAAPILIGDARTTLTRIDPSTPPCQFTVSPTALFLSGGAASGRITVIAPSGCQWAASSPSSWLTVAPSGVATGSVEVLASANPGVTRAGSVTVANQVVTVEQAPQSCAYTVSPLSVQPFNGSVVRLDVTTAPGCPWQATGFPAWITPSVTQGIASGSIDLTFPPNPYPGLRSVVLSVAGIAVNVQQSGPCSDSTLTNSRTRVPAYGGDVDINIAIHPSCAWSVSPASDLITLGHITPLTPLTGSGQGTIRLRFAAKPSPGDLPVLIEIRRPADQLAYYITQAGSAYSSSVPRIVTRNSSGHFELYSFPGNVPVTIQGSFATSFASAQDERGFVFLAAIDSWGALSMALYNPHLNQWSAWKRYGGVFRGTPAIAARGNQALLAIRDSHNSYWTMTADSTLTVSNLRNTGGVFATDPALAMGAGLEKGYVVGKDLWNALWSLYVQIGASSASWTHLGGVVKSNPSVAIGFDGRAYIAARDSWDGLWVARLNGVQLLNWSFLGGVMSQDPLIKTIDDGTIATTIRDSWSTLWTSTIPESATPSSPVWTPFGGVVDTYAPAVHNSILYIAAKDLWNNLWWVRASDKTWTYVDAGGRARGVPSVGP